MKPARETTAGVALTGLRPAPAQQWGAVRLVPLLRDHSPGDLRLAARRQDAEAVHIDDGTAYYAFMPHALVATWSSDGHPLASYGAELRHRGSKPARGAPVLHRLARREDRDRLRFVPLHLAMEGFLALHFNGPDVAWTEYSREALSRGLSPRSERTVPGLYLAGLADALRVFEIHDRQVGLLLFVADALAGAFVVPHPDDYRALHHTLLTDFYGELLYQYGLLYGEVQSIDVRVDPARVHDLTDLAAAVAAGRAAWHEHTALLAAGLFDRATDWQYVYQAGPFRLSRFIGELLPDRESHIGEAIHRSDGTLEYLKTFRLSAAQIRRAYLLQRLAAHDWHLGRTAVSLGETRDGLLVRLRNAGFAYLLKAHLVRDLPA
ncbi:MAG: hypothetical protein JNL82_35060 [Myxococcales bacterium]|nr:hypothetical protein [Myxococcales bacterium]